MLNLITSDKAKVADSCSTNAQIPALTLVSSVKGQQLTEAALSKVEVVEHVKATSDLMDANITYLMSTMIVRTQELLIMLVYLAYKHLEEEQTASVLKAV